MTNTQKLRTINDSCRVFADTITNLANHQGSYQQLVDRIDGLDDEHFASFQGLISQQSFKDAIDVIFYLEV